MQTVSTAQFDNPTVEVALYTQGHLYDIVGRDSELSAVSLLQTVFEMAGLNYEIRHDFPVQNYAERTSPCGQPFETWNVDVLSGNIDYTAKDCNILLVDGRGGGCSNDPDVDPGHIVVGATPLADFSYALTTQGMGIEGSAAHSLLHEVGHNLGWSHTPHGGFGFNQGGRWWRTPTVGGNAMFNRCNEYVEFRHADPDTKYLFFHWCAISDFRIVGGRDPTPPGRDAYPPTYNGQLPPNAEMLPLPPQRVDPCAGVTCPEGQECIEGECFPVDPCADVTCGPGEACVDGECVVIDDPGPVPDPERAGVGVVLAAGLGGAVLYALYNRTRRPNTGGRE